MQRQTEIGRMSSDPRFSRSLWISAPDTMVEATPIHAALTTIDTSTEMSPPVCTWMKILVWALRTRRAVR
jgi:hypothetical protein